MARPKSQDKRNSILEAAIEVFAERGVTTTPTAAVSKAAGIAEGSLFTYFSTKDELLNELYRELKRELSHVLMDEFPRGKPMREKFRHIWAQYVKWGVANPSRNKVMLQLRVSDRLTEESKQSGYEPFAEIERAAIESVKKKELRDYPVSFIGALMSTWAETTMVFMTDNPRESAKYSKWGFEMFWNGIANE